jgi:hypothetical protein
MLEDELEHGKIGLWQPFDHLAQLQNFDAPIWYHYLKKKIA